MFFEIALIAPTASGKTALANALAYEFNAVILSLDSLCVYKQINIASAKPDSKILSELSYFGINLLNVNEHFNVSLFMQEYLRAKNFAKKNNRALIIVGGTSFYLKMMLEGLSKDIKESNTNLSNDEIYALLKEIDPAYKIEKNDTYRLKKWLGIYEKTNQIPSVFLRQTKQKGIIKELEIYELCIEKELLLNNIMQRTKTMFNEGLIEEASFLFKNYDENLKSLNSIGLKECKAYLKNEISLNECENLINTHTAQLAKRQRTFNKKFNSIKLNQNEVLNFLRTKFKKM
ncbi:tRNA (adenosine(37)-N6)-dimethylallyltransferase MiaA [Campylobacter sp. LR196d]|uniref:tRNA (adenosine(37)-N6)-dimethylallyltransferase MiaA n=1 Tax=Campylobacter sp. LR196d TaxID=2593543 RepID=UPI00123BBF39|nr:tRNA (adenosine(37)-N6)-dimethylallyltransferase MiaA [Campylobacter sp. LR196d]KAA6225230.1 tRNA (adenosine(37)-N6)-dimethylallyltransferase MiaA [Campylobacter sp. LR196d]